MLLPLFILIPFISGLICWYIEKINYKLPRLLSLISMIIVFSLSLFELIIHPHNYHIHNILPICYTEFIVSWIPSLGISFHLALDGLSIIMIMLTGILGIVAVLCSWNEINKWHGLFHLNLLWILSSVIGVFLSVDMFLFFLFWEIMLIPMYFLISLWGHNSIHHLSRIKAATKFFIYTQISGFFLLIGILILVVLHQKTTGILTFEYNQLLNIPKSLTIEYIIMLCFFIAFAIKIPIVPLHGWLPDAHSQAPTAGSVDLAGILLKTAAYGLLRFALPLCPITSEKFAIIPILIGMINIFYGSWMACTQYDIKKIIAYTSIAHMGFILIGIYSHSKIAYQGVIIQMIAHGISAAAQFILCGQIYERLKTRNIHNMGGLWKIINLLPGLFLFFSLASLGLPGTGNFIGEFLILLGAFNKYPILISIATFGILFASIYSLNMMQKIFYGPCIINHNLNKMMIREKIIILFLLILLLILGFYPQPILNISYNIINNIYYN
ncbi:NADH-quinone oxidoreductase subunit M [Enterobacteriaceae endosymbiont of Neohaemonia nigricornis]|uniref:NADH-quinone oxidoreductase subunit M n=1 Tax=Enterobacteriaceae endosymbiont of Neohaemonia nigricornis TaxID=2675792 RepID=UPI0014498E3C|nr:NADH-quinone oxidoreductase subunit M [Enterobacteriaceae endosymbiont of Neohaemonia nigricornis]QJC30543.1 NADH-quinone oxidoreductase subunit M [Enterobacteriaceae endosymbiont of Neohaemonia nigricornis]